MIADDHGCAEVAGSSQEGVRRALSRRQMLMKRALILQDMPSSRRMFLIIPSAKSRTAGLLSPRCAMP